MKVLVLVPKGTKGPTKPEKQRKMAVDAIVDAWKA